MEATEVVAQRKPRKRKTTLSAELTAEIDTLAHEILLGRQVEARKVAALELAARSLEQALVLLSVADFGGTRSSPPGTHTAHVTTVKHPCTWCGTEGVKKGVGGGWLCPVHAKAMLAEERDEALNQGLMQALRTAQPAAGA